MGSNTAAAWITAGSAVGSAVATLFCDQKTADLNASTAKLSSHALSLLPFWQGPKIDSMSTTTSSTSSASSSTSFSCHSLESMSLNSPTFGSNLSPAHKSVNCSKESARMISELLPSSSLQHSSIAEKRQVKKPFIDAGPGPFVKPVSLVGYPFVIPYSTERMHLPRWDRMEDIFLMVASFLPPSFLASTCTLVCSVWMSLSISALQNAARVYCSTGGCLEHLEDQVLTTMAYAESLAHPSSSPASCSYKCSCSTRPRIITPKKQRVFSRRRHAVLAADLADLKRATAAPPPSRTQTLAFSVALQSHSISLSRTEEAFRSLETAKGLQDILIMHKTRAKNEAAWREKLSSFVFCEG